MVEVGELPSEGVLEQLIAKPASQLHHNHVYPRKNATAEHSINPAGACHGEVHARTQARMTQKARKKMGYYPAVEKFINRALAPFDITIARQSRCDSENQGQILSRLSDNARVIGSNGACDAFIAFSARDKQENDEEIKAFMHFFAEVFRHSRSQWAQDVFVMYASAMKVGGCYLEIGGADGLTHSNTLSLRDSLGWSGTLVEPDPDMHALLKAARGHSDQVIHAAISPSGTTGTGLLRRAGQLSALLGHEGLDIHSEERKHHETTAAVSLVSLTELIRSQPRIDYFSLDVEGAELSILESINWQDIVPPGLITVEHNFRTTEQDKLRSILLEQGYLEQFSDHDWLRKGDLWMRHKEYTP